MFEMLLRKLGEWTRRDGGTPPESRTLTQRMNPMNAMEDALRRAIDHLQVRMDESALRAGAEARKQVEASWPTLVKEVEEATSRSVDRATTQMAEAMGQQITRADGILREHREQAERQGLRIVLAAAILFLVVGAFLIVLAYVLFT